MTRPISDCMTVAERISDEDMGAMLDIADRLQAGGMDPNEAGLKAAQDMLSQLSQERGEFVAEVMKQNPQLKPARRAATAAQSVLDMEAETPPVPQDDEQQRDPVFTRPNDWTEEGFAGPALSRRENTRQAMLAVLDARNRTIRRVNPASVLEDDIGRAARAMELVVDEIAAGRYDQTEVPIGPMPHVLHMLGAPMQMLQINTSIIRKVLVDKHSKDFADITPRQLIEGIYKPAMVMQARAADEFEVTTNLVAKNGQPVTAAIKVNTPQAPLPGGKQIKVGSVMSAYSRQAVGGTESLLQRVLTGKLRYVEMERAHQALNNFWTQFQPSLSRGLANRTVRGELDLIKFIGDNYKPDSSPMGWDDAPAFSRREDVSPIGFYSELARKLEAIGPGQAKPAQWRELLRAMPGKGVKADEIDWSGVTDWLDMQGERKVPKAEVLDFIKANGVRVEEVVYGENGTGSPDTYVFADSTAAIDWLGERLGMSRDEVIDEYGYADPNDYVVLAENMANSDTRPAGARYGSYTLPGGTNYREVLLTLPVKMEPSGLTLHGRGAERMIRSGKQNVGMLSRDAGGKWSVTALADIAIPYERRKFDSIDEARAAIGQREAKGYRSSHWGDLANPLAHIRLKDRIDVDGKRVLFVEELQSDWGQEGKRKGFDMGPAKIAKVEERDGLYVALDSRGNVLYEAGGMLYDDLDDFREDAENEVADMPASEVGNIPAAPFVTKTDGWLSLALKRVIGLAVDGGYDKVAFVNGDQSAERYDLSKQIDHIDYRQAPPSDDTYDIAAVDINGREVLNESGAKLERIEELVGKEIAQKIANGEGQRGGGRTTLRGLDLKVGGEGMRAFYDKIVPNAVKSLIGKMGGKPATVQVSLDHDASNNEQREWNEAAVRAILRRGGEVYLATRGGEVRVRNERELADELADAEPGGYYLGDNQGTSEQPGFEITDAMREKVAGGLPLFSRRERPAQPQPMMSRRPQRGRFNLRNFNIGHKFIEAIQDRYNRWKQTTEDIASQGGTVTEANDFYRAEERYWGIVGAQTEDFGEELQKFVDEVAKDKLMLEDVALYAYAQHAPERNAWIAAQRATMPDGGSGMLTQDALDLLDEARQAGLEPALQKHAATLRQWIQGTRDVLFNGGLIDQDQYDAWTNMMPNYVPLRGLDGAPEARGTGQGFNIRGAEGKAAMGRKSQAKQIIEQIVQDRTRALIRVGKNDVVRSFGQFVIDNPSPNLWEINAVENKPITSVDANGNRIIEERQQVIADERTITFKDAGKEVHVLVHDEKLLEQLKNLNADNPSRVVGAFLFVNKILARLYTSLNPVFTVVNAARDVQAASVGMIDEIGFMAVPRLLANMPKALIEAHQAEAKNYSPDYSDFRNTGGKTGFFNFRDLDEQTKELQALLRDAERSIADPRKFGPAALRLIESINSGIENGIRLAAFKTARQAGSTLADAARISKNITVNFNRRGAMTPTLSAYFLFFNPAVQGTARIAQAIANPKVMATLGAGMLGIAGLALRNAGMGEDDDGVAWWDKIPAEVKERNLVIVLPPGASGGEQVKGSKIGRYVKIPMPYGYNFFAVVANQAVDVWRNSSDPRRGAKPLTAAAKAFTAFMGAWVPVQELGRSFETPASAALAAVPDALNPLAQVAINLSSFGRPLYPDDQQSKNNPDSSKYFPAQAGTIFQRAAESMNSSTGGDRYRSGLLDVTPAALEQVARGYGGGPVTFAIDLMNALYLRQNIERATPRYEALPFVKQLYGVIDAETDRMVGYQRLEEASKIVDPMLRARREGGPAARAAMADMREELGPMLRLADTIEQTRQSLSDVRKRELKILSSEKPEDLKYVELMAVAQKRREVLQRFNAAYDRALLKQSEAGQRGQGRPPQ